jgi:DNA-binding SARP family transcriptional activator
VDPDARDVLDDLSDACQREGDRWGEALVALLGGAGRLWRGEVATPYFERAARIFDEIGAGVVETAAHAYLALAAHAAGDMELATRAAHQARNLASLLEVPGSAGLAALALARLSGDDRELARAKELLEPLGTWHLHQSLGLSPVDGGSGGQNVRDVGRETSPRQLQISTGGIDPEARSARVRLRCLGGFSLVIDGRPVDEAAAKPMERALLHLLAMRAGQQVHREALIEALWPEADPDAGLHRLQVAISSLRRLLALDPAGPSPRLVRQGDSYGLAIPEESDVDLWQVDGHVRRAATARQAGQIAAEEEALATALAAYGGPLLPGDGPADWVVGRRASLQAAAVDAAVRLANLRLERGAHQGAAETARLGLSMDRYRDELWKLLISAADRFGHHAEAGQARRAYAAMLEDLGV